MDPGAAQNGTENHIGKHDVVDVPEFLPEAGIDFRMSRQPAQNRLALLNPGNATEGMIRHEHIARGVAAGEIDGRG